MHFSRAHKHFQVLSGKSHRKTICQEIVANNTDTGQAQMLQDLYYFNMVETLDHSTNRQQTPGGEAEGVSPPGGLEENSNLSETETWDNLVELNNEQPIYLSLTSRVTEFAKRLFPSSKDASVDKPLHPYTRQLMETDRKIKKMLDERRLKNPRFMVSQSETSTFET